MISKLCRLVLVAGMLVAFSCGRQGSPLNVVVIAIDSLRPDALGCYGYERHTSPNIDLLAAQGVHFENTISQAPWTTPSFGTVFTSLYPSQHGATSVNNMVRPTVPTLATMLKARGYATAAMVNAPALNPEYGINRGFDFYDAAERGTRDARGTSADAITWIASNSDRPFLLFLHYFDVHLPYAPPPPYDTLFDPTYKGWMGRFFDPDSYAVGREKQINMMGKWSREDWNHARSLYDGELAFTDEAIGTLVKRLNELGLRKKTLIVLLSDHGEEFFEHGAFGHSHTLFSEILRVPLIFSLPGGIPEGTQVRDQVRLLDVTPTILDLLGVTPKGHFEGASLIPLILGRGVPQAPPGAALPPDVAFSEAIGLGTEKKSVTTSTYKVIHDIDSGETMFFDLARDPGEKQSISDPRIPDPQASVLRSAVRTIYETAFRITDTWYLEMRTDGIPRHFDIAITSQRGLLPGQIRLARVIDAEGNFHDIGGGAARHGVSNALELRNLGVESICRLAFKSAPEKFPLMFDFQMDGRPATAHTYLGSSLAQPDSMPFAQHPGKTTCRSRGEPSSRPKAPYVLVWMSESGYEGDTAVNLSDQTKKELRSLGYVQ